MTEPRPIGMRIPRPYATEEEFIQGDGLAIGRMGMILIGAPARPPGIVVRFELLLRSGEPVFRGEGKVVAHRMHANGRQGLEVRFTRLDKHSKALVEHVLELRKAGAITPAHGVPDLGLAGDGQDPTLDPEISSRPELSSQPDLASRPELSSQPDVVEPALQSKSTIAEPSAEPPPSAPQEPDATVVDASVAEIESRAMAERDEPESIDVEPPLDEEPTPFMPAVSFDDHVVDGVADALPPQPITRPADPDALQRLRERSARFEPGGSASGAIERLRARLQP